MLERNPDTVRAPDIAFVTPDRANLIARRGFFPGPPDLAVEVLSPDDTASELLDKVNDWLRAGTRSVWLVDGERRTVTIYRSDAPLSRLAGEDTLTDCCPDLVCRFPAYLASRAWPRRSAPAAAPHSASPSTAHDAAACRANAIGKRSGARALARRVLCLDHLRVAGRSAATTYVDALRPRSDNPESARSTVLLP